MKTRNLQGDVEVVKVDNFELKEDLYYWTKTSTWGKIESDGNMKVGLTDVGAATIRTGILEIRPKPLGTMVKQGEQIIILRLPKAINPVESPISGTILKINSEVQQKPQLIKDKPYESWIILIKPTNLEEDLKNLLKGSDPRALEWYIKEVNTKIKR